MKVSLSALATAVLLVAGCTSPGDEDQRDPRDKKEMEAAAASVDVQLVRLEPEGPPLAGVKVRAITNGAVVHSATTNSTGHATLNLTAPGNYTLEPEGLAPDFYGVSTSINVNDMGADLEAKILILDRSRGSQEIHVMPSGIMGPDQQKVLDRTFSNDSRLHAAYIGGLESLVVQILWINSASSWADFSVVVGSGDHGYAGSNETQGPTTQTSSEEARVEDTDARDFATRARESFWIRIVPESGVILPPGLEFTLTWQAAFGPVPTSSA